MKTNKPVTLALARQKVVRFVPNVRRNMKNTLLSWSLWRYVKAFAFTAFLFLSFSANDNIVWGQAPDPSPSPSTDAVEKEKAAKTEASDPSEVSPQPADTKLTPVVLFLPKSANPFRPPEPVVFPASFSGKYTKTDHDPEAAQKDSQQQQNPEKRGSWIIAPIPIISPAFGNGIIIGGGYIFKLKMADKVSPPSVLGAAAVFTSNGSRAFGVGGRFYFAENKYQGTFLVGKGRGNLEYFGQGRIPGRPPISVDLRIEGSALYVEFMRNIWKDIFIGPRFQYRNLSVSLNNAAPPGGFQIPPIDVDSKSVAIGFHVQRDTRDSTFYPTKGSLIDFAANFFAKPLGSARTYQTYSASYNRYMPFGPKTVLAYRLSACSVSTRTPFYDQCLYGSRNDLRGYTTGQFNNHRMFATQIEYRRHLFWRIGGVGFIGMGGVARSWDKFKFNELLPAGGAGIRFRLDKKNKINYRVDWAVGRAGHTLTIGVTEAF